VAAAVAGMWDAVAADTWSVPEEPLRGKNEPGSGVAPDAELRTNARSLHHGATAAR
jgi:hypothetical protein